MAKSSHFFEPFVPVPIRIKGRFVDIRERAVPPDFSSPAADQKIVPSLDCHHLLADGVRDGVDRPRQPMVPVLPPSCFLPSRTNISPKKQHDI